MMIFMYSGILCMQQKPQYPQPRKSIDDLHYIQRQPSSRSIKALHRISEKRKAKARWRFLYPFYKCFTGEDQ